jgi:pyruvyltransferase
MIDQITKSGLTISSSLHAIIIAEAYGRKGIFLKTRKEDPFKYRDYLLGTERSAYEPAESINEALQAKPLSQAIFDYEMILKSFPFDLYKNK